MYKINENFEWVVGVDEVGRGPVAGPVTAGACICRCDDLKSLMEKYPEVTDSKKISEKKRSVIADKLKNEPLLKFSLASNSAQVIDDFGISPALKRAVGEALVELNFDKTQTMILLDGSLYAPENYKNQVTIIKGDQSEWLIGAASIIAKVHRDAIIIEMSVQYPEYGLDKHKGYGTKAHFAALVKHGTTPIHRTSFLKNL